MKTTKAEFKKVKIKTPRLQLIVVELPCKNKKQLSKHLSLSTFESGLLNVWYRWNYTKDRGKIKQEVASPIPAKRPRTKFGAQMMS